MLEIDGLIGLQHLFCYKAHSYQTMAKYDCPGAVHVNVKDKHRSSPVAWVCCMGQHCDHNLWLDSLFHSSLAALGAILWSLLSQLATVSLKMSIHLQIQVFLHTDALAYWKAYFIGPALLSEYPFRERNECTFGIFFSVRVFNWQLEGNFLF